MNLPIYIDAYVDALAYIGKSIAQVTDLYILIKRLVVIYRLSCLQLVEPLSRRGGGGAPFVEES